MGVKDEDSKVKYDYPEVIPSLLISLDSLEDSTEISRIIVRTLVRTLNLAGACLFTKAQSGSFEVNATEGSFTDKGNQNEILALISQF